MPLVLGLDVGTQGARAVVCSESGEIVAQWSAPFPSNVTLTGLPHGWFEQRSEGWWLATVECIEGVMTQLAVAGRSMGEITAVAVDSTSGTVLPVGEHGVPLHPAIMYSDVRANDEARECNDAGSDFTEKLGYKFGASFGLPKILWLMRNKPEMWQRCVKVIHAADFIVGKLCGEYGVSDNSNALKSGYDLVDDRWPSFVSHALGIERGKLPSVVSPGEPIGRVSADCAKATRLPQGTVVTGGISDGTAGFVASGASDVGEWNSTLGTTLVLRGVSRDLVHDPCGRIYCHRHPDGWWLPGGASNVGGECLERVFPDAGYEVLNGEVERNVPSGLIVYPLVRRGERLPFIDPNAEGFLMGSAKDECRLYAGYLEGVAFVERWCYELMGELGAEVGDTVCATGGGAKSIEWMRIRSSVLNKRIVRPMVTESAMGAAVVAASRTLYSNLTEASKAMIRRDVEIEPDAELSAAYAEHYRAFRDECARRGLG